MRPPFAAALLLSLALPARALDVPPLTGRVVDDAGIMDAGTARSVTEALAAYDRRTGRQIAVLTLPSLEGEPLEEFSLKVARTWALGHEGKDDGVLILVARDDRKVRIEVGYGLEGALPDAAAGRIISERMVPRFRNGDYSGGVRDGADAVMDVLDGGAPPAPGSPPPPPRIPPSTIVFYVVAALFFEFLAVVMPGLGWTIYALMIGAYWSVPGAFLGFPLSRLLTLAHTLGILVLKLLFMRTQAYRDLAEIDRKSRARGGYGGSGWFGGSGGWSGGGGGFSGGGGSFGGGGASGSW